MVGAYLHGTRIGALVVMKSGDDAVAKDIAMHVAAINPARVTAAEVPADEVAKEKGVFVEQAAQDPKNAGKPSEMLAKIIEGKIRKWLNEITLLGQPFVKDDDQTVETVPEEGGRRVLSFVRYEVGSGIEKKQEDFAEKRTASEVESMQISTELGRTSLTLRTRQNSDGGFFIMRPRGAADSLNGKTE